MNLQKLCNPVFLILFSFTLLLSGCNQKAKKAEKHKVAENSAELQLLAINSSQYGVAYPETFVLQQNRKGIRIEYCVDRSNLQLWISPQAGKSMNYIDRNWSNRDDHTNVFDRILLPGLNLKDFIRCEYDAFHSVLYFKNQTLHIANIFDQPVVMVWFEKEGIVDLKTDKGDKVLNRSDHEFMVEHTDRSRAFKFVSILGKGEGKFRHQMRIAEGRSVYSRANLKPNQVLFISAELASENVAGIVHPFVGLDHVKILSNNETKINQALSTGKFKLKNRPAMQKLLDENRRIALSMQDEKGFMRSTNQYIYYLLWYRDGGMNTSHLAYSGWLTPAKWQADFAILNPNVSNEEPKGKFYGQVLSGNITKWEEDGLFYVVWPAFSYWTQSGDELFCKGQYLKNMEDGMAWLEKYCFDQKKGLFGRYYYCESPMTGSRDDGWDNAVGSPNFTSNSSYKGKVITRAYDLYINSLNYSVYLMLSAMETGAKANEYLSKALALEKQMKKFYDYKGNLPSYGDLQTNNNTIIAGEPFAMDRTDYQWSMSLPPFTPNLPAKYKQYRQGLYHDIRKKPEGNFLCSYNAILTSMDTEIYSEDSIMTAMDYLVPQSVRPGKFLPMGNTIPEIVDIEDGDPFHDVRPLVFSIAPWLSAVTNLGIRRLPFGIAVRATKYLDNIENYEYKGSLVNINYQGEGSIESVLLNGKSIENSFQIPENQLIKGKNQVVVKMKKNTVLKNTLISSTSKLLSSTKYTMILEGFGKNILVFKNLGMKVNVKQNTGKTLPISIQKVDNLTYIEFVGRGKFLVELN